MPKKPPASPAGPSATPARKGASRPAATPQPATAPPANLPDAPQNRWQRTVRYGWDKGGSKGGRR